MSKKTFLRGRSLDASGRTISVNLELDPFKILEGDSAAKLLAYQADGTPVYLEQSSVGGTEINIGDILAGDGIDLGDNVNLADGDVEINVDIGDILSANAILTVDQPDLVAGDVTLTVDETAIDHDALTNFVADEHIAHSGVTLTAGVGLAGGGTIAANRTFDLDITELTADTAPDASADYVVTYDASASAHKKVLLEDLPATHFTVFDYYIDLKERLTEDHMHGTFDLLATGQPLDTVPTTIAVTAGIGKIVIAVIAGSDLAGSITITGTSVDRDSGTETASDTDSITVDAVTTDNTATDSNGNTIHRLVGAYISSKWFRGAITLSTTNLTLTDVDVYQVAFEQANDVTAFTIDTLDITADCTNTAGWLDAYLFTIDVTGSKCTIDDIADVHISVAESAADKTYQLRRSNLAATLAGASDGFWVELNLGPLANTYWEDVNVKVWTLLDTTGSSVSVSATDNTAIHDNVAGEINAITDKDPVTDADIIIIEDSAAGYIKKKVTLENLEDWLTLDNLAGTLAIAKGGTGQTGATAAFDALAPTTTQGDTMYHDGTDNVRLAKGTAAQVLTMNAGATAPEWATPSAGSSWFTSVLISTADQAVTGGTAMVDITGMTYTMAAGKTYWVRVFGRCYTSIATNGFGINLTATAAPEYIVFNVHQPSGTSAANIVDTYYVTDTAITQTAALTTGAFFGIEGICKAGAVTPGALRAQLRTEAAAETITITDCVMWVRQLD